MHSQNTYMDDLLSDFDTQNCIGLRITMVANAWIRLMQSALLRQATVRVPAPGPLSLK